MFDFVKAFEWLARAFSSFFQYKKTNTEHQSEADVIKSKKTLKKTTNKTFKILFEAIKLLYKYRLYMSVNDRLKVSKIIKKTKGVINGK